MSAPLQLLAQGVRAIRDLNDEPADNLEYLRGQVELLIELCHLTSDDKALVIDFAFHDLLPEALDKIKEAI